MVSGMTLSVVNITFDSADPDRLAEWWARAVDGTVNALAPGFFVTVARPGLPGLAFQKVEDPTPGKNRVHIDFTAADMEAEVKRLVDLGASETGRGEAGPEFRWVVLSDPDGNAFCVAGGDVDDAT
jgi:predicted enzyme related to lactoylglutathione lyase